jgi:hypothetical protein
MLLELNPWDGIWDRFRGHELDRRNDPALDGTREDAYEFHGESCSLDTTGAVRFDDRRMEFGAEWITVGQRQVQNLGKSGKAMRAPQYQASIEASYASSFWVQQQGEVVPHQSPRQWCARGALPHWACRKQYQLPIGCMAEMTPNSGGRASQ